MTASTAASRPSLGHGPDPDKRDTVLAAVKDASRRFAVAKRPSLTASARGVTGAAHGRDEETALRSNKETGPLREEIRKSWTEKQTLLTGSPIQGWAKAGNLVVPK